MRCQTLSSRFWVRGLESPSQSLVSASSKRLAKRSTIPRSLAARSLGEAVQAHLLAVLGQHLVQMHAVTRCGLDAHRRLGVEVAGAFPTHHQVTVSLVTQPLDAVLGGDSAVHHHQGGARGVERIQHLGQRVMFAHVAGEHLRAAHESTGIEHQPQGEERAIGAFSLGVSASCLGLSARLAFEIGIGQVIKRNRRVQVEQVHRPVEHMVLDGLAVRHQRVGGAIQPHRSHRCEVHAQQFAQGAAFAQPAPGGALGARACHARDNRADGGGA